MAIAVGCWQAAPEFPVVSTDQIDLWRFRLDLSENQIELLKCLLSADEITRAERLRVLAKRQQFIIARANLRQILSRYLNCEPNALCFQYSEQGKPALLTPGTLLFNLSHSGHWGVLAVSAGEVGVDIEKIDPVLDCRLVAKRYFSTDEIAVLESSSVARQHRTFYRLWTAKESSLKQKGSGFSAATQITVKSRNSRHFHLGKNYIASVAPSVSVACINKFDFV